MFRNVIFDLGNVLVFFDHSIFYNKLSEIEDKFSPDEIKNFVTSKKFDQKLSLGKIEPEQVYYELKKKFHLKTGYRKYCEIYGDIFWTNKPMKTFLEKLIQKGDKRLFLLSNTDVIHFNYIKKNFPFVMKIPNRVLSYKVGLLKPDVKIYKHLIEKYRINPSQTCFIDDIKAHVIAAEKTGITGIHYTSHELFLEEYASQILH